METAGQPRAIVSPAAERSATGRPDMRDFKGMKRQRNRGRGGGGGKPQHNANRAFDSNGPDGVKVRGAAQHIYEKYQQLARDASSSGDRVLAENYLQHAEHYFRVLRAMQPQRPVGEIIGRDQFASGYDIDFEDEGGQSAEEPAEAEADGGQERQGERPWQRDERQRDERDERQRDERQRDDRDYRQREDRPPGERSQGERQGRYQRDDRRDRPPREFRGERDRGERAERDPLNVIEPQATPLTAPQPAPAPYEPREGERVLRGEDGAMSQAPAFLQAAPRAEGDEEPAAEPRRPRRRRAPRSFEPGEAPAAAEADEG